MCVYGGRCESICIGEGVLKFGDGWFCYGWDYRGMVVEVYGVCICLLLLYRVIVDNNLWKFVLWFKIEIESFYSICGEVWEGFENIEMVV